MTNDQVRALIGGLAASAMFLGSFLGLCISLASNVPFSFIGVFLSIVEFAFGIKLLEAALQSMTDDEEQDQIELENWEK